MKRWMTNTKPARLIAESRHAADRLEMPMIHVRNRDGGSNKDNIEYLEQLLQRRFAPEDIMTEPAQTTQETRH